MRDTWGSTGIPEDNTKLPLLVKVRGLIAQDVALAEGARMRGFSQRQSSYGFRQAATIRRPPEVEVGALFDLGS